MGNVNYIKVLGNNYVRNPHDSMIINSSHIFNYQLMANFILSTPPFSFLYSNYFEANLRLCNI